MSFLARPWENRPPILTEEQFRLICCLVYDEAGLVYDESKRDMVENRVDRRLKELPDVTVEEYMRKIQFEPEEKKALVDALTVNETYFYRDLPQLAVFQHVLSQLIEEKLSTPFARLRIWSAACSVGCEPFTIAMMIDQELERRGAQMEWSVLGTDISASCLRVAQSALYTDRELKDVPPALIPVYFRQTGDYREFHHPCRSHVQFRFSNLLRPGPEVQGTFDAIFCRNILIYFDDASRRRAAEVMYDKLVTGGHLFLGPGDSMNRISRAFELRRIGSGLAYVKP